MRRIALYITLLIFIIFLRESFLDKKEISKVHRGIFNKENLFNLNDVDKLLNRLDISDQKWRPKKTITKDGSIQYSYLKLEGEVKLNKFQLDSRIKNFDRLFSKEKKEIKKLLNKLNSINVTIYLSSTENNIGGIWNPKKNIIMLDSKLIDLGTKSFHNVLAHESIHVAQSCYAGSLNSLPKRLGLPVDFSISIDNKLSHPVYSKNSDENISIEREAYSYSDEIGVALSVLSKYCK